MSRSIPVNVSALMKPLRAVLSYESIRNFYVGVAKKLVNER